MQEQPENEAHTGWLHKEVYDRTIVDDMETSKNWSVGGIGEIEYTSERSGGGSRSLRFTTSMRDEDFTRRDAGRNGTFSGRTGGYTTAMIRFDEPRAVFHIQTIEPGQWNYVECKSSAETGING